MEEYVFWNYIRQFIKTAMGNVIPISWLFVFQRMWGVRFDGVWFWSIYAGFTLLVTVGIWFVNRSTPDPSHLTQSEIPTPFFGILTAMFQPIVFLMTWVLYCTAFR